MTNQNRFTWYQGKNYWIRRNRGIAFEDIVHQLTRNEIIDIIHNHKPKKYPDQHLFLVIARGYLYAAPFSQDSDGVVRLITAYAVGKLMRNYGLR